MARICLVTGATRGIGRAISDALKSDGYEVVGLARNEPDDWSDRFIACDITNPESLESACTAISELDTLWGVVNNAGVGHADALEEITLADMDRVFLANAIAPALITQAAVARMQGEGRVLNICSTALLGKAERSSYGASKAALASLTRTWALELGSRQITVNAISPGPIETELFRSRNPIGSDVEQAILATTPVGRIGEPRQIASLARLILDPISSYLTGQIITVDGGSSVGQFPG